MKRKILLAALSVLLAVAVNSCEALSGCKVCQDVTYEDGVEVYATPETEFCGDELVKKEATDDVTVGNQVIKVRCR